MVFRLVSTPTGNLVLTCSLHHCNRRSVAGVILQSPLLSAYRVAFNFRFTCIGDKFPNVDYANQIRAPVFIVHGTQDEVRG